MKQFSPSTLGRKLLIMASSLLITIAAPQRSIACENDLSAEITTACTDVKEQRDLHQRLAVMQRILVVVVGAGTEARNSTTDEAITCVSAWLSHDDNYSKMNAAMILSRLACRSKNALPALREALLDMPPLPAKTGELSLGPAASPTDSVVTAIREIEQVAGCGV